MHDLLRKIYTYSIIYNKELWYLININPLIGVRRD